MTFAAGAILGGRADVVDGASFDVLPGWLVGVGAGYRFLDGEGSAPFVLGELTFGVSRAHTKPHDLATDERATLTAVDTRVGAIVGKTFGAVSPYLAARLFGGPVTWTIGNDSVTGGDKYHFQIGAGLVARLGDRVDVAAEADPLGERRAIVSIGFAL